MIPYSIFMILLATPVCLLEYSLGQFTGMNPVQLFEQFPLFSGVGWAMVGVNFVASCYFTVVIGYALLFFYHSIPDKLSNFVLPFADESDYCKDFYNNTAA